MKNSLLLGIVLCMLLFSDYVLADIGAKPATILKFVGMDNENYRVTIISNHSGNGMKTVTEVSFLQKKDKGMDALWWAIQNQGYEAEGWKYVYQLSNATKNRVEWGYHPPEEFRIAIYFPEQNKVVISKEILKRYAFRSYFQIYIKDSEIVEITAHYNFWREIVLFLMRLLATLAIEVPLALLFGFRKREYLQIIVKINVWTQVGINLIALLAEVGIGPWVMLFIWIGLEVPVFLIEARYYAKQFKKLGTSPNKVDWAVVYAFVANIVSFIADMYLQGYISDW